MMKVGVLLLGWALFAAPVLWAEEVDGQTPSLLRVDHDVAMQSAPGKRAHVTRKIESGTLLTVLNKSTSGHYTRVRLESGPDGWVLSSDLTGVPAPVSTPAAIPASESPDELRLVVSQLQTELNTLRLTSANALATQNERDQLQESVIRLKRENEMLLRDKNALEDEQGQSWFLLGAGVGLGGIILGVLLPQLNLRRRNNWNSF